MSAILGQPVVVANKPGASGVIAMQQLLNAPADGYTLASVTASNMAFAPHLQSVGYTLDDFTFLAGMATQPFCLCVRQDAPWKTMDELLGYARTHPGKLSYGHPGTGQQSYVVVEALKKLGKLDIEGIPYKGDSAALMGLMGGEVEIASVSSSFVPFSRNGQVRPLAMIGERRLKEFPDIPTLKELGFDVEMRAPAMLGYAAPKGLPPAVRAKLETALRRAIESPEFGQALAQLNNELNYRDGEAFRKEVAEIHASVGTMLADLGLARK